MTPRQQAATFSLTLLLLASNAAAQWDLRIDRNIEVLAQHGEAGFFLAASFAAPSDNYDSADFSFQAVSTNSDILGDEDIEITAVVQEANYFNFSIGLDFSKQVGRTQLAIEIYHTDSIQPVASATVEINVAGISVQCSDEPASGVFAFTTAALSLSRFPRFFCKLKIQPLFGAAPSLEDLSLRVREGQGLVHEAVLRGTDVHIEMQRYQVGSLRIKLLWPGFTAWTDFDDEEYTNDINVQVTGDPGPAVITLDPSGPFSTAGGERVSLVVANIAPDASLEDFTFSVAGEAFEPTMIEKLDNHQIVTFLTRPGTGQDLSWRATYNDQPLLDGTRNTLFSYEPLDCSSVRLDVRIEGATPVGDQMVLNRCASPEVFASVSPPACGKVVFELFDIENHVLEDIGADVYRVAEHLSRFPLNLFKLVAQIPGTDLRWEKIIRRLDTLSFPLSIFSSSGGSVRSSDRTPMLLEADLRHVSADCLANRSLEFSWFLGNRRLESGMWGRSVKIPAKDLSVGTHAVRLVLSEAGNSQSVFGSAGTEIARLPSPLLPLINDGQRLQEVSAQDKVTLTSRNSVDPDDTRDKAKYTWHCLSCETTSAREFDVSVQPGEEKIIHLTVRKGDRAAVTSMALLGVAHQCPLVERIEIVDDIGRTYRSSEVPYHEHYSPATNLSPGTSLEYNLIDVSNNIDSLQSQSTLRPGSYHELLVSTRTGRQRDCKAAFPLQATNPLFIRGIRMSTRRTVTHGTFTVTVDLSRASGGTVIEFFSKRDGQKDFWLGSSSMPSVTLTAPLEGKHRIRAQLMDSESRTLIDQLVSDETIDVSSSSKPISEILMSFRIQRNHLSYQSTAMAVIQDTRQDPEVVGDVVNGLSELCQPSRLENSVAQDVARLAETIEAVLAIDSSETLGESNLKRLSACLSQIEGSLNEVVHGVDRSLFRSLVLVERHFSNLEKPSTGKAFHLGPQERNDSIPDLMMETFADSIPAIARAATRNRPCGYSTSLEQKGRHMEVLLSCHESASLSIHSGRRSYSFKQDNLPSGGSNVLVLALLPGQVGDSWTSDSLLLPGVLAVSLFNTRAGKTRRFEARGELMVNFNGIEEDLSTVPAPEAKLPTGFSELSVSTKVANRMSIISTGESIRATVVAPGLYGLSETRRAEDRMLERVNVTDRTLVMNGSSFLGFFGCLAALLSVTWSISGWLARSGDEIHTSTNLLHGTRSFSRQKDHRIPQSSGRSVAMR